MFRRKQPPIQPVEWLIVGLGNPGPEYRGTRHNLGFELVDRVADSMRIKLNESRFRSRYGVGQGVVLMKPLTYMNLSGQAVAPLAKHFQVPPEKILVISDDTDLAPGRIRLKPGGGAGGHNGHKSIIQLLGTQEYPRLKIGIGRVEKDDTIDHVLGGFTVEERAVQDEALSRGEKTIRVLLSDGLEAAMNIANVG